MAREHWGKRLRARGGARSLRSGRATSSAPRHIVSLIEPSNKHSIRVAEKLGERLEGDTSSCKQFDLLVYGADLPLPGSR